MFTSALRRITFHCIDDVEHGNFCLLSLRERQSELAGVEGLPCKTGRVENALWSIGRRLRRREARANREHRAIRLAKDAFGGGPKQHFPDSGATACAGDQHVDVVFSDQLLEFGPDLTLPDDNLVAKTFKLAVDDQIRDLALRLA